MPDTALRASALELVTLYRDVVRLASPEDALVGGLVLGRALAAMERLRSGESSERIVREDLEVARQTLARVRDTVRP